MSTTDDLHELFDIVDLNDRVIGTSTRKECNSNPDLIHRAVFVLISNSKNQFLWQKRSLTKDTSPGKWVTSVSGHVNAGDDYEETAVRESEEELGIKIEVEYLGKFLFRYPKETEYSAIFKAYSNGPFEYNEEEISEIRFMTLDEILAKEQEGQLTLAKPVHLIIESLSLR
ncbi:MAG: NUDIX domain-containing protein [Pseudomonadota bacterium]